MRWWATPLGGGLVILCAIWPWLAWGTKMSENVRHQQQKELEKLLGLEPVKQFTMPIHVNLIFIGFDSKLQHSATLSTETLKRHMEAQEGGVDSSFLFWHSYFLEKEYFTVGHKPEKGHVVDDIVIDVQTQVVELAPLTHMAIEAALKTFVRLESLTHDSPYQLDADKMGSLLESLLHATNLSDYYTLFIFNPDRKVVVPERQYGYRTGFSTSEIHQLHREQLADRPVAGPLREDEIQDDFPQDHDPDHEAEAITKTSARGFQSLRSRAIREASEKWASSFLTLNRDVINAREKALKSGTPAEQCGRSQTLVLKDENDAAGSHDHGHGHAHGEGHRINVQYNVSAGQMGRHIRESGSDSEKQYLDLVLNKGPEVVRENCMTDVWQSRGRYAWIDLGAGSFKRSSPSRYGTAVNTIERLARPDPHLNDMLHERAQIVSHWTDFCRSRGDGMLSEAERDLCEEMHMFKVDPLLGKVKLDSRHADEAGGPDKNMNIFLKHLKVTVQNALRHLLVRPVAAFKKLRSLHLYTDNPVVRFEFYITADHNSFRPTDIGEGGLDLMSFRHEMKKFALPNQEFSFHIVHLEKKEVETLWQAVHRSVIDVQELGGSQYGHVNASSLGAEVSKWVEARQSEELNVFQVPIFLFSVARSVPLLFDEASQAVAAASGIVAFQSHHHKFPSGFSCGNQPVFRSLRDPMKAVLSASALFLTGLLPDHYTSPQMSETSIRADYLWSVGDSPLSATSHKAHFSALHRDMAHRQSILAFAQSSIDHLHRGMDGLMDLQEKVPFKKFAEEKMWKEVSKRHNKALQKLRQGLAQVSNLDFVEALKSTTLASAYANDFELFVRKFATPQGVLRAATKGAHRMPGWFGPLVIFIMLLVLGAAAFFWWRTRMPTYKYRLPTYKNR